LLIDNFFCAQKENKFHILWEIEDAYSDAQKLRCDLILASQTKELIVFYKPKNFYVYLHAVLRDLKELYNCVHSREAQKYNWRPAVANSILCVVCAFGLLSKTKQSAVKKVGQVQMSGLIVMIN
jgi:hypothetical protein